MARHGLLLVVLFALSTALVLGGSCRAELPPTPAQPADPPPQPTEDEYAAARAAMVEVQLGPRGIQDERVLAAMRKVPRHEFVPEPWKQDAYIDSPLPIGEEQTISQPYIVALMTELLELKGPEKVLEIGTGSGYQAAVLAELCTAVYTIEILEPLAEQAEQTLKRLGYEEAHVRCGDGWKGWPERKPFDGIIITCAAPQVPSPLVEQLKVGGRVVVPIAGEDAWDPDDLVVGTKQPDGRLEIEKVADVRFVPMTGSLGQDEPEE